MITLFAKFIHRKMSKDTVESTVKLTITGYNDRVNDIIYGSPEIQDESNNAAAIVYFGGDIQDFRENMKMHRDNKRYVEWSLEDTVTILQKTFPKAHVFAVRPSRMELNTFSCFNNFVQCSKLGVPEHSPMHFSVRHLELILENIYKHLFPSCDDRKCFSKVKLIGFSKGCVVLNQFIYEIHDYVNSNNHATFFDNVTDMYWLDGGHSGGKNTWVTSEDKLKSYASIGINTHIHVSPYQIKDERRPWIGKEEKRFYNLLFKMIPSQIRRVVHFENQEASIFNHFMILKRFNDVESDLE